MIRVKVGKGVKDAKKALLKAIPQVKNGFRKGLYLTGKKVEEVVKQKMTSSPRSGRKYRTYRGLGGRILQRPRTITASAAGEYPAVVTGALRKSVGFKVEGHTRVEVGADTPYARTLEIGGGNIAPRQYLKQTVDGLHSNTRAEINRQINMRLKSLGFTITGS